MDLLTGGIALLLTVMALIAMIRHRRKYRWGDNIPVLTDVVNPRGTTRR